MGVALFSFKLRHQQKLQKLVDTLRWQEGKEDAMADFSMECEECGQQIEVPEEMAGETAECPSCGAEIVIPDVSAEANVAPAPSTPEDAVSPSTPEVPEPSTRGFGKSLLAATCAAASEAKRGAKITGLKAKIEKLRRVDLQRAYRELGQKAYEIRFNAETHAEAYAQIEGLEARIDQKRAGVHADKHGTLAEKARAAASTAKMKAEAEALAHKRGTKLQEVGRALHESGTMEGLGKSVVDSAAEIEARICRLSEELACVRSDTSARNILHATAEATKHWAESIVAAAEGRSSAASSVNRRFWSRRPVVLVLITLSLVAILFGKQWITAQLRITKQRKEQQQQQKLHQAFQGLGSPSRRETGSLGFTRTESGRQWESERSRQGSAGTANAALDWMRQQQLSRPATHRSPPATRQQCVACSGGLILCNLCSGSGVSGTARCGNCKGTGLARCMNCRGTGHN